MNATVSVTIAYYWL